MFRRLALRTVCVWLILMAASGAWADAADERTHAEELALRVYFEGVPPDAATALSAAGADRLMEMLVDPGYAGSHANTLLLLGLWGGEGAYEALASWALAGSSGAVDRAAYRARRALPEAMGHLARRDPRALSWLTARAQTPGPAPWWFGSVGPERIGAALRANALLGIGLSGRPEARAFLEDLAAETGDPALAQGARRGLAAHARVAPAEESLR